MPHPPLWIFALTLVVPAAASCRRTPRSSDSANPTDASGGILFQYRAPADPLELKLALQLTHTSLGLYLEAGVLVHTKLEFTEHDDALRMQWTIQEVETLELEGTVSSEQVEPMRSMLLREGHGVSLMNHRGLLDVVATQADPLNVARTSRLTGSGSDQLSEAVLPVVSSLIEHIQLPRLPNVSLRLNQPLEIAEESETVITDTQLVLPTTTVYRFTLQKIETIGQLRVAEIGLEIASIADNKLDEDDDESALSARIEDNAQGTLTMDLDHDLPISLDLTRTQSFRVGEREVERSLQIRGEFESTR